VVGKCYQPKVHFMKLGNVNGKKNVVGEYFLVQVVNSIGTKKIEKSEKKT
tara:strand:+ start:218 stop:367 length:150 start_codon:yes stop_codon:yes gene_type:complete